MNERRKLALQLLTILLLATPALAQEPLVLDDACTVTVGNQTAEVLADGSFVIENIAVFQSRLTGVAPQLYRVRATCLRHGQMVTGQSDFFELAPGQATFVADVFPAEIDPLPREILASAPSDTILPGQSLQLRVQAILPDTTREDVTNRASGTTYVSSNPELVQVTTEGRVTSLNHEPEVATAVVAALHEGQVAGVLLRVEGLSDDLDGDGLPNEYEERFGLDPFTPDAFRDRDGDGLSNRQEFELGTLPDDPDTDLDGLPDGTDPDPLRPDEMPPTLQFTTPSPERILRQGETVLVRVQAEDDGRVVGTELFLQDRLLGGSAGSSAAARVTAPFAATEIELTARAVDFAGNVGEATARFFVEPDPGATVRGRVVDASGNPVVGARVSLRLAGLAAEFFDFSEPLTTFPDLSGRSPDVATGVSSPSFLNPLGALSPDTFGLGLSPDYALRLRGDLSIRSSGVHTFRLGADDGARLRVDGQAVIEVAPADGFEETQGAVSLEPGTTPVEIEHVQGAGVAEVLLRVGEPAGGGPRVLSPLRWSHESEAFRTVTEEDGTFEILDVPSVLSQARAVVRLAPDTAAIAFSEPVALPPGGVADVGDLTAVDEDGGFEDDFGSRVFLGDDDFEEIAFEQGFRFPLGLFTWSRVFVNSNGNLTFGSGDRRADASGPERLISAARIAPLFNDLDPTRAPADGGIFVRQEADRFVVTWHRVPQFREGGENTFQVILFADGRIRIGYGGLTADGFGDGNTTDTLDLFVGLSPGRFVDDPALRRVDYTTEAPLSLDAQEAVIEHFTEDGSFDLDGLHLSFAPTPGGGFDVQVGPGS